MGEYTNAAPLKHRVHSTRMIRLRAARIFLIFQPPHVCSRNALIGMEQAATVHATGHILQIRYAKFSAFRPSGANESQNARSHSGHQDQQTGAASQWQQIAKKQAQIAAEPMLIASDSCSAFACGYLLLLTLAAAAFLSVTLADVVDH